MNYPEDYYLFGSINSVNNSIFIYYQFSELIVLEFRYDSTGFRKLL